MCVPAACVNAGAIRCAVSVSDEVASFSHCTKPTLSHTSKNDGGGVLLFTPFHGAAFEDEPINAAELVLFTAVQTVGATTLDASSLFSTVLVLKLCTGRRWSTL